MIESITTEELLDELEKRLPDIIMAYSVYDENSTVKNPTVVTRIQGNWCMIAGLMSVMRTRIHYCTKKALGIDEEDDDE